jgi:sigma-B regulation protein RsbU (phosphoserine phosphatase)
MASDLTTRFRALWLGLNIVDLTALAVLILIGILSGLHLIYPQTPQNGFLIFLAICALFYLAIRAVLWARDRLLWTLRNQLITAYIFIAVVPVLLLLAMAGLAAYLLYWQLGSYVLYTQMQERVARVGAVAEALATSSAIENTSGRRAAALALPEGEATYLKNAMKELPGLKIDTDVGNESFDQSADLAQSDEMVEDKYRGLVFVDGALSLRAVATRQTPSGELEVTAIVPLTPEMIDTLPPELGPIEFDVLRPKDDRPTQEVSVVFNRQGYTREQQIATQLRTVPSAANPFDKLITGIVTLNVLDEDRSPIEMSPSRVIASFSTRPSLLNHRLFSPLGELGGVAATLLLIVGTVFLFIEFASLVTGIVITRTITSAVDDLYRATQHVQAGDFSFRVRVTHHDQLAELGESFNSMTQSVSTLIEEQGKRQKLENELSIAHEVQLQLFPHTLPKFPGVELEAICRAARSVSGDYYDFIRISPTRLGIALADISGKGISAALLMANVQAALRSDVLRYRNGPSGDHLANINTAEIISHLNRHLFRNSSDERYATCFFGVYDSQTRRLCYTNAGHLPPIYLRSDCVKRLETGGMVVGLFNDVPFEQGTIEIEPGGLLMAYSDGLIEPENVYGEEFGTERLIEVAKRNMAAPPTVIAEAMMNAAEEWSSSPEQADDMTVVVMRFTEPSQEPSA